MIVVRDVFQLQFGKAREAKALIQEGVRIEQGQNPFPARILTDLVGNFYTLILETEYPDLATYESSLREGLATDEWKQWYARFTPLVREGRREIYQVVQQDQPMAGARQQQAVEAVAR